MMRVGEGERLIVPTEAGVEQGDSLRIAVRPEQVQIGLPAEAGPNGGSRLTGTLAEVVYLGMYTQFHVETGVGRVVAHRLADEDVPRLRLVLASPSPGTRRTLPLLSGFDRDPPLESHAARPRPRPRR